MFIKLNLDEVNAFDNQFREDSLKKYYIDELTQQISQTKFEQIKSEVVANNNYIKWGDRVKFGLSISAGIAATAALVGGLAISLFSDWSISNNPLFTLFFGSGVTVLSSIGALYLPLSSFLNNLREQNSKQTAKTQLFDRVALLKSRLIKRKEGLDTLKVPNSDQMQDYKEQHSRINALIFKIVEVFQEDVHDERLVLI